VNTGEPDHPQIAAAAKSFIRQGPRVRVARAPLEPGVRISGEADRALSVPVACNRSGPPSSSPEVLTHVGRWRTHTAGQLRDVLRPLHEPIQQTNPTSCPIAASCAQRPQRCPDRTWRLPSATRDANTLPVTGLTVGPVSTFLGIGDTFLVHFAEYWFDPRDRSRDCDI